MKNAVIILGALLGFSAIMLGVSWFYQTQARSALSKRPEHGVCFTVEIDGPTAENTNALAQLRETVQKRFWAFGSRIFWEPLSPKQARVYAPILDKDTVEAARGLVSERGCLELRLVHPQSQDLITKGMTAEGFEVMKLKRALPSNHEYYESYLVKRTAEGGPSGITIQQAAAIRSSSTEAYEICFTLGLESAEAFRMVTRDNVGRQLAVVMDGVALAAPIIRSEIAGGSGVISGNFDRLKAFQLAALLRSPLPFPTRVLETRSF